VLLLTSSPVVFLPTRTTTRPRSPFLTRFPIPSPLLLLRCRRRQHPPPRPEMQGAARRRFRWVKEWWVPVPRPCPSPGSPFYLGPPRPFPRFRSDFLLLQGPAGPGRRRRPLRALQVGARYGAAADCLLPLLPVAAGVVKTQPFRVLL